jgi:hypothetical protein
MTRASSWKLSLLLSLTACGAAPVIGTVHGRPVTMRSALRFQDSLLISDFEPEAACKVFRNATRFIPSFLVSGGNVGLYVEFANPVIQAPDAGVPRTVQILPVDPLGNAQQHSNAVFFEHGPDGGPPATVLSADFGEVKLLNPTFGDDRRTQLTGVQVSLDLTFGADEVSATFEPGLCN